jgi:hypothetical protein
LAVSAPKGQVSIEDDAAVKREERMAKRLEQIGNWIADVESRLPAMRRETDSLLRELRRR